MAVRARRRRLLAGAATASIVLPLVWLWQARRLPDSYDLAEMGYVDWGDGPAAQQQPDHAAHDHHTPALMPVADLVLDPDRPADVTATLTVRAEAGGYTVNGHSPGPVLEATVGDVVEVTLVNVNVAGGTTLHWHGVDVPNAADGVAGVTQDAVPPGEQFVYRFEADRPGTYWYHSHQVSHEQVRRGLLGALVVHPAAPAADVLDQVALLHEYDAGATLNGTTGVTQVDADPGQRVRVRVINTDNGMASVWVTGATYTVEAVDGTDLHAPDPVTGQAVGVPAGGRVDLGFEVPAQGARVDFSGTTALVFGADPTGGTGSLVPDRFVDLLSYGEPIDIGFDPASPDRRFEYRIGRRPGFLDGRPGLWWTINGHLYPDVPMYMVREGDVVVFRIENDSPDPHPMHLHGHHAVVLSRNGDPATGSPWWVDSLEVKTGETYEIAFVADNPGLWMDHCHNLPHATEGLVAHLMYDGVASSYSVGGHHENEPE